MVMVILSNKQIVLFIPITVPYTQKKSEVYSTTYVQIYAMHLSYSSM